GRRQSWSCPADAGSLSRCQCDHPFACGLRRGGGHGLSAASRRPRRCSSPGSHIAGSQPPQNGWPRGSGAYQGRKHSENDPYGDPDHFRLGSGYCEKLSAPGELLPHQAGEVGCVRESGEEHQRFLADQGQVAASRLKRMPKKSIKMLLLVEDNLGDARLLREMLNEQGMHKTELMHVECLRDAEK